MQVREVYEQVRRAQSESEVCVVRTKNAVSICTGHPSRTVQIILRLYRSPAHVLGAFDLDCVAVGWDGRQVLAMPRCLRALSTKTNLMELSSFRTLSYSCEVPHHRTRTHTPSHTRHGTRLMEFAWGRYER